MPWNWKTATPQERGNFIRRSAADPKATDGGLRQLFNLTDAGLEAIALGGDWKPEYEIDDCPCILEPATRFADDERKRWAEKKTAFARALGETVSNSGGVNG